ncbi:MAG: hypothetical protein H0X42_02765 [Solirubrobacterales bacterium]|nr:hypothetical protein [Solirubrobacterales bacterium]
MARGSNEHRMVFDIRGKRRHVVKVVYAILALLMGASLFLVVGPVNIAGLFGTSNSVSAATGQFEEQAEHIEHKLVKEPGGADLLLALTKARINAGNSSVAKNSEGGIEYTVESKQQLEKASEAWSEYLKATKEPSVAGAEVASQALFTLAQLSRTTTESEANIQAATGAQKIVAEGRPSLNSLSTLSFYSLYTFDYKAAQKALKEASTKTNSKFERENLENQFEEISKRAHEFQKQVTEANKAAKAGAKQGAGSGSLENPLGGLGGGTSLSE